MDQIIQPSVCICTGRNERVHVECVCVGTVYAHVVK